MKTITIETEKPYDIIVGTEILADFGSVIKKRFGDIGIALITDDIVESFYGNTLRKSLEKQGYTPKTFVFPNGEGSKNLHTYGEILSFLAESNITRSDLIVALGGGVVGDMAGFAAATFLRGIPFIQVPTTLLAAVDSSVGGKTGVNLCQGKNLAGAFHQPSLVYCDYTTMTTMEKEPFADGIAEAIKYGVLGDEALFQRLAQGDLWSSMEEIIVTCLTMKRKLVMEDTFDKGQRQLLNLGHTLGHAIEKESSFTISHGHAVSIGMVLMAKIAKTQGLAETDCVTPLINALKNNDLPTNCPYSMEQLQKGIEQDKKRQGNTLTFVVPKSIGNCILYPVPISDLKSFLKTEA